ncbi:MAG TPA: hypothetical protein VK610_06630 [Rhodothermales bacterium]|nr:hypothetical protein [Rhodothermales bacterium]
MPERSPDRFDAMAAAAGPPAPTHGRVAALYVYALDALAGERQRAGFLPFTPAAARVALAEAAERMVGPLAPDNGPQPDPADVAAFLRATEAAGYTRHVAGVWSVDLGALPF